MWLFFSWEGTKESVQVSSGLMARVKLSDDEEVWTGYMLEERRSVKSTYSRFRILFLSFSGRGGKCWSIRLLCSCDTRSKLGRKIPGVTVFTSRGLVPSGLGEGRTPFCWRPSCALGGLEALTGERRAAAISPAGRRDSVPMASALRTRSWSSWPLVNAWSVLGMLMTFCDWRGMFAWSVVAASCRGR